MSSTRFTQQHIIELNEKPASSLLMNRELQNIYEGANELDDEAKIHRAKQADPTLADTETEKHVTNAQTKKWEDTANAFSGVSPSSFVAATEVVTTATANKILKLNADGKLSASITGDADTVDGKHATAFQEVAEKDQPGGYVGLDNNGALNSKIRSTYISDFNTATIGGLYYWGTATLNAPSNIVGSIGTLLVIDRLSSAWLTQIAIEAGTRSFLYIRSLKNISTAEWTDWRRLDEATWGSISGTLADQTDLQSALDGKQSVSEKDQPGGYVGLDAEGKIPVELLDIADPVWGSISGTLSDQTDLQTALDGKANTSHSHNYAPIPTSSNLPVGAWCVCWYTVPGSGSGYNDIPNGGTVAGNLLHLYALDSAGVGSWGGTLAGTWKNIFGATVKKPGTVTYSGLFVRIA